MFSEEQCDGPHGETSSLLDGGNNNIAREGTDNIDGAETTVSYCHVCRYYITIW